METMNSRDYINNLLCIKRFTQINDFLDLDSFFFILGVHIQDPGLVSITCSGLTTGRLNSRPDGLPPLIFLSFLTQCLGSQFKGFQTDLLPALLVEVDDGTGIEHPAEVFDLLHLLVQVIRRRDKVCLDDLLTGLLVLGFILGVTILYPVEDLKHIELILTTTGDKSLDLFCVVYNHIILYKNLCNNSKLLCLSSCL